MAKLGITSDGASFTRRLSSRTRRLKLYKQDLVALDLAAVASKAPNLETLELGSNPLRALDLTPLTACPHLEGLVITAEAPIDLAPLAECANLRWLHIHAQGWPALDLAPLAGLTHFESLLVHGGAFEALALAPLATCAALRSLSLHCPALRQTSLAPLAAASQMTSLTLQHTPLTALTLFPWPHFENLNLLAVPITEIDLLPLHAGQLTRFQCVQHALTQVDLTPLVELETLSTLYFQPLPRLLLDDVYVHHPARILSPAVRADVEADLCIATGRGARLKVLLARLRQAPPSVSETMESYAEMDEATFWRLIADAKREAPADDLPAELVRRLWALPDAALQRFHELFWRVMGQPGFDVHETVFEVRGGCSDDDFIDFREWLITQGRERFYRVVNDPQVLHEWGEGGLGFEEGVISQPLYLMGRVRGVQM